MFPLIRSALHLIKNCPFLPPISNYHILSRPRLGESVQNYFLAPVSINLVPNCGFKVKGRLKRRCKDCYFVMRQQRLYVLCKTHGRHKQMSMVKDPKNTWILTHATQGKVRPW